MLAHHTLDRRRCSPGVKTVIAKIRRSEDALVRYRLFWTIVGVALSVTLIAIGSGYAFAGKAAAGGGGANFRVIELLPGGVHTHGMIMLVLALCNLWGLAQLYHLYTPSAWAIVRVCSVLILFYGVWVVCALVGAYWLNGQYSAGVWWYVLLVSLAGAKVALPPPFTDLHTLTNRDERV